MQVGGVARFSRSNFDVSRVVMAAGDVSAGFEPPESGFIFHEAPRRFSRFVQHERPACSPTLSSVFEPFHKNPHFLRGLFVSLAFGNRDAAFVG